MIKLCSVVAALYIFGQREMSLQGASRLMALPWIIREITQEELFVNIAAWV